MIIWSGWGILIPLIVAVVAGFSTIAGGDDHAASGLSIGLILSGVIVLFVGKRLNDRPGRTLVDPETGEQVVLRSATSSLFFIPMQWWGPVIVAIGVATLVAGGL